MVTWIQALISGALVGGMYALLATGLTLSWGLLRTINLAHFSLVLLAAYATHTLSMAGLDPLTTILFSAPVFFGLGVLMQYLRDRLALDEFTTLIVSFGLFLIFEHGMKLVWSADFRRLPLEVNPYFTMAWNLGPFTLPVLQLVGFAVSVGVSVAIHHLLFRTTLGAALRAAAQDLAVATAFGVDAGTIARLLSGVATATAACGGWLLGLLYVIFPAAAEQWIGVTFAIVILGGLGNPLGTLAAGMIVGTAEALTATVGDPSTARLVSLVILTAALLFRPQGLFRPAVMEVKR